MQVSVLKTVIKPLTDLSKNMAVIDSYIKQNTPVYITKGGASYMVVVSHQYFEKLQEEVSFLKRLAVAEAESRQCEVVDVDHLEKDLDIMLTEDANNDTKDQSTDNDKN